MTMVTTQQITNANNKKTLDMLERWIKKDKDYIVDNTNLNSSVKKKARKDYIKKLKLIRRVRKKIK